MYPILLKVGPFTLRSYGLFFALAFLVATLVASREAERKGLGREAVFDFAAFVLLAGLAGASLFLDGYGAALFMGLGGMPIVLGLVLLGKGWRAIHEAEGGLVTGGISSPCSWPRSCSSPTAGWPGGRSRRCWRGLEKSTGSMHARSRPSSPVGIRTHSSGLPFWRMH